MAKTKLYLPDAIAAFARSAWELRQHVPAFNQMCQALTPREFVDRGIGGEIKRGVCVAWVIEDEEQTLIERIHANYDDLTTYNAYYPTHPSHNYSVCRNVHSIAVVWLPIAGAAFVPMDEED